MRRSLYLTSITVGLVIAVAACIDLTTDPNEIVAIEFDPLPAPAIVIGDSLRDSVGVATPLSGKLIDGAGQTVTETPLVFLTRDTTVDVKADGTTIAHLTTGPARLFATGAGLQSIDRIIDVVPPPDTTFGEGTPDTLMLIVPDDPTVNVSAALRFHVNTKTGTGGGVKSWIVRYTLSYQGQAVVPGDTSLLFLANDAGRPAYVDTTDASGVASTKVRFKVVQGRIPLLDSIFVTATLSYRGALVPGAPVRMVVPVKPK